MYVYCCHILKIPRLFSSTIGPAIHISEIAIVLLRRYHSCRCIMYMQYWRIKHYPSLIDIFFAYLFPTIPLWIHPFLLTSARYHSSISIVLFLQRLALIVSYILSFSRHPVFHRQFLSSLHINIHWYSMFLSYHFVEEYRERIDPR